MLDARPLDQLLLRAGAVMTTRGGRVVAGNYGSAAGELAVCVRAVGLVDRSDLSILGVHAPPTLLGDAMRRLVGRTIAVGGALPVGGSWWCRESAEDLLVVCDPQAAERLTEQLRLEARRSADFQLSDRSPRLAAIGLVGRSAALVLAALDVYGPDGDPRAAAPVTRASIGGVDVLWLLQSDRRALAVVDAADACDAWRAIERAGRPFGLSCVGLDAAERFSLIA